MAANANFNGADAPHPALLTRKAADALARLERLLDDADHALAAQLPGGTLGVLDTDKSRSNTVATADRDAAGATRGD